MNDRLSLLGLIFGAMLLSWFGVAKWPVDQVATLVPGRTELRDGKVVTVRDAAPGALAYTRLGCFVCHTRQVGPADIAYGWGKQRTGPGEWQALGIPPEGTGGVVGLSRLGPDLTFLSSRRKREELAIFLKTHGGGADSKVLADWLLSSEPKEKKP